MSAFEDSATHLWEEGLSQLAIPEGLSLPSFSLDYFKERFTETSSMKDAGALLGRQIGIFEFKNYERKLVFVEWRTCDNVSLFHKGDAFVQAFILAQRLAIMGPPQNLLPVCIGFVGSALEGETRFGYIFEMPEGSTEQSSLKTLQSILGDSKHKPDALRRVSLAKKVATALSRLHKLNWLHRGVHSGNILFCVNEGELDVDKPILSGFEYPRPQSGTVRPNGLDKRWIIYPPPHLQNEVPRAGAWRILDDIYSLGLLILEIGHWQTLHTLLRLKISPVPSTQALRVRSWLIGKDNQPPFKDNPLSKLHDFLAESDTEGFLTAASRCVHACGEEGLLIEEWPDQFDESVKAHVLKAFSELVIKKLDTIKASHAPGTADGDAVLM